MDALFLRVIGMSFIDHVSHDPSVNIRGYSNSNVSVINHMHLRIDHTKESEVMEVTESFRCECNGVLYKNRTSLRQHQSREVHKKWVRENELFDLRCRCKRLENENESLKYVIEMLKNNTMNKIKNELPKTPRPRPRDD